MGNKLCCCCCRSENEENERLKDVILSRQPPPPDVCRGNLLVFINPHSGRGQSLETFVHTVAPKLDKNFVRYEVVITTGPKHAKNVLATKNDLEKFNGVLILSGDGLVFEALNGILCREDAFWIFPTLPIGIIPSGSGNGLLCSVLSKYGEKMDQKVIMDRALDIASSASPKAESVALMKVETDNGTVCAFLSIGWGLMADIDIESEQWRKSLGAHRFTLSGFIRSFMLRTYKGRLTYRPYQSHGYVPKENIFNVYDKSVKGRIEDLKEELNNSSVVASNQWTIHDDGNQNSEEVVIEDEFINIYAVSLSQIASDGPFAPSAKIEDNRIHLSYILKNDISTRLDIAKYLLAIEHQTHLEQPFVKRVEASYMKIETIDEGSYVVIDGEVVDTKSLTVSSTRNNMSVFSPAI